MAVSIIQQLYVFVVRLFVFLDLLLLMASTTRSVLLLFLVLLHLGFFFSSQKYQSPSRSSYQARHGLEGPRSRDAAPNRTITR